MDKPIDAAHRNGPWLDAMAAVLGLEITPQQRAGVLANLAQLAAMAAKVDAIELPDDVAPAPRFEP